MAPAEQRREWIDRLLRFPLELERVVHGLSEAHLTTPYLPQEWTVAQNVHHLVDSHANAYIRTRLLLTEASPTVKPYDQDAWALLPDAVTADIQPSLAILKGLHLRWAALFDSLTDAQFARAGQHPEYGEITVEGILESYVLHGAGHIDQIERTLAAGRIPRPL